MGRSTSSCASVSHPDETVSWTTEDLPAALGATGRRDAGRLRSRGANELIASRGHRTRYPIPMGWARLTSEAPALEPHWDRTSSPSTRTDSRVQGNSYPVGHRRRQSQADRDHPIRRITSRPRHPPAPSVSVRLQPLLNRASARGRTARRNDVHKVRQRPYRRGDSQALAAKAAAGLPGGCGRARVFDGNDRLRRDCQGFSARGSGARRSRSPSAGPASRPASRGS